MRLPRALGEAFHAFEQGWISTLQGDCRWLSRFLENVRRSVEESVAPLSQVWEGRRRGNGLRSSWQAGGRAASRRVEYVWQAGEGGRPKKWESLAALGLIRLCHLGKEGIPSGMQLALWPQANDIACSIG